MVKLHFWSASRQQKPFCFMCGVKHGNEHHVSEHNTRLLAKALAKIDHVVQGGRR